MTPLDLFFLCLNISITNATLAALEFVFGKKILRNQGYKRLIGILLVVSILQSISNAIYYFFGNNPTYFGWIAWFGSVSSSLMIILFALCQIELLTIFSPLCPYWNPTRVFRLKVVFAVFQIVTSFPSYLYPLLYDILRHQSIEWYNAFGKVEWID
jgi:hypothetical protein